MSTRAFVSLRSALILRSFPERLSGICLVQANTLRSIPDRLPPLSEGESRKNHVPCASNLSIKFIVFLASLHGERLLFFKAAKHSSMLQHKATRWIHSCVGRRTGSGVSRGLYGLKNDRVVSLIRKILARAESPMESVLFNTLFEIKQLRWSSEDPKLRSPLPLLRRDLLKCVRIKC